MQLIGVVLVQDPFYEGKESGYREDGGNGTAHWFYDVVRWPAQAPWGGFVLSFCLGSLASHLVVNCKWPRFFRDSSVPFSDKLRGVALIVNCHCTINDYVAGTSRFVRVQQRLGGGLVICHSACVWCQLRPLGALWRLHQQHLSSIIPRAPSDYIVCFLFDDGPLSKWLL